MCVRGEGALRWSQIPVIYRLTVRYLSSGRLADSRRERLTRPTAAAFECRCDVRRNYLKGSSGLIPEFVDRQMCLQQLLLSGFRWHRAVVAVL